MKFAILSALTLTMAGGLATTAAAQTVSAAQCEQMLIAGTAAYPAATVAACQPHYQALADRAVAQGTFGTPLSVSASTSGSGG